MVARTLTSAAKDARDAHPTSTYGQTDSTVASKSHEGILNSDQHVRTYILITSSDTGRKIDT